MRLLFGGAVVVAAALCLAFAYLPMVDLPQHYAMVSIFRHYDDPAYGFSTRYTFDLLGRPYATVYLLGAGLSYLMPLGAAMRIVVAICTVAPIVGLYALLAALERPREWALAAVPFAFGSLWFWGFLNFLLGTGLFLGGLALTVHLSRGGGRRAAIGLGVLGLATLFTHVHGVFMLLPLAPPFAWAWARDRRAMWRALLPLAPTAIATAAFVGITWRQAIGTWPRLDPGFVERVQRFPDFLAGGFPAPWPLVSTGVLALIAIAAFVLRDRTQPLPRRRLLVLWGALLGQWLLYFALPLNTSTATYVSARHAILCALFVVPLLPPVRRPVTALAAAFALAGLVLAAVQLYRFNREAHDFEPILAAMKPNKRVVSLIFDKGSRANPGSFGPSTFPYLHFAGYYQAARGGDLAHSFAVVWNVPVRYRSNYARHPFREEIEWQPRLFSLDEDLPHYDYVLLRANGPMPPPPNRGLEVAAQNGPWTLVENPRAVTP